MYLYSKLQSLNKDISICFIGCGKFISMFLSQYNQLQKIKITAIVDINIERAKSNCKNSGLSQKTIDSINFTNSLDEALKKDLEGKNIQDTEIRQKMSQFLEAAKKEI